MSERRFDGLLLDFYGTVVHEDDVVIAEICERIHNSIDPGPNSTLAVTSSHEAGEPVTLGDVGHHWWALFSASMMASHGPSFVAQRELERRSLTAVVDRFGAACDTAELLRTQFAHWRRPPIFADAVEFLDRIRSLQDRLPIAVVSNIDRSDIEAAMDHHGLRFDHVITSEDVRSYKPRRELFAAGLQALGLKPSEVLHIGDSITSDVTGANDAGLSVAWVNRSGRPRPGGVHIDHEVATLTELLPIVT